MSRPSLRLPLRPAQQPPQPQQAAQQPAPQQQQRQPVVEVEEDTEVSWPTASWCREVRRRVEWEATESQRQREEREAEMRRRHEAEKRELEKAEAEFKAQAREQAIWDMLDDLSDTEPISVIVDELRRIG